MSAENVNVEENLTDLINDYLPKAPEEYTEDEEVETQDNDDNTSLTPQQLEQARAQIFQEYKKAQAKTQIKESQKTVGTLKDKYEEQVAMNKQLMDKINKIEQEFGGVKSSIKKIDDQTLTKDYLEEEEKIAKHPKYGQIYDKTKVREAVINKAQKEGRYFSPAEELKLQNFDAIFDELLEARKVLNKRKEYLGMNQGTSTLQNAGEKDYLADVQDMKEAKQKAMQEFSKQLGL